MRSPQPRAACRGACANAAPAAPAAAAAAAGAAAGGGGEWQLQYAGPQATALRYLKAVSITTATLSVFGSPFLCYATSGSMAVKAAGATSFALFSIFTTGLLHWFTGPYVHRLWYNPVTRQVKVQKLTLFAQYQELVFNIDDIRPPTGYAPLQTFDVDNRTLYVDSNFFDDKELLAKLTPQSEFDMPSEKASDAAPPRSDAAP